MVTDHYSQKWRLRKELADVLLVKPGQERSYKRLREKLSTLRHRIESFETWGSKSNQFSEVDEGAVCFVQATLHELQELCMSDEMAGGGGPGGGGESPGGGGGAGGSAAERNSEISMAGMRPDAQMQEMLRKLNTHEIALSAQSIYQAAAAGKQDSGRRLTNSLVSSKQQQQQQQQQHAVLPVEHRLGSVGARGNFTLQIMHEANHLLCNMLLGNTRMQVRFAAHLLATD